MRNAHRTAQPALTAKQPQTRAAWLHAAVTAPVHTPHRVVFLSKGESQPMESTVAVGRGRQPHTAQGWVGRCPAGGLLLSTRICAERSSEHHTQLKYPPQSDEQRGCVTKGKRSIQKNQSSLIGNVILNALAVPTLLSPRASAPHLPTTPALTASCLLPEAAWVHFHGAGGQDGKDAVWDPSSIQHIVQEQSCHCPL